MKAVKLKPACKDYLWGGTKLKTDYGIEADLDKIAEAWVLSCHKDGASVIENGEYKGFSLAEAIDKAGSEILGTNCAKFEFFPILIKLIDAKDNLSIQVHPSDEYALRVEGEYGKTEMWYVVDCEPNSYLYYGFNRVIDKKEFARRIEDNTLTEVLNKVEVKKGDCFFIASGTIHAIGAGILIAEIQQNSNTTYRVSDYGRLGADGLPRELHVDKALDVTILAPPSAAYGEIKTENGEAALASCKYFTVNKLEISGEKTINVDETSFVSLLCLSGNVEFEDISLKAGECAFIPAGAGEITLSGEGEVIVSRV